MLMTMIYMASCQFTQVCPPLCRVPTPALGGEVSEELTRSPRHPRGVAHRLHQLVDFRRAVLGERAFGEERPGQMFGARRLRGKSKGGRP